MVFREVDVFEVREVLRGWLDGVGCVRSRRGLGWTVRLPAGTCRPLRRRG